jgi:hypothetical protein
MNFSGSITRRFAMFDLSRATQESARGGEVSIPRLRELSLLDVHENRVEPYLARHADITYQQMELLERIRVAAGQTS